ncbi:YdeI family protein [Geodermatophilus sp. DSM 44513]|uniref:YdeI/OmpD-associated family protein n=1 Tax=Geodermatophilus sp. DSM 44513 TaxID=1528104 RepID=UPI00126C89C8|nr:YdeI/OmpD-associated family protein [Geodermatophilus sp. DSM 44513]WNV77158.1 YdeI/OmpD-associated family protein [Geodermatophilus sp. DSM 44513]
MPARPSESPSPPAADRVHAADRSAWRSWLADHAATSGGVWLVYDKGPGRRLTYDDVVEEALCFGWVDSRPAALDDTRAMLYVAPRRPGSSWSRKNKQRVARLRAAGLMTPAGEAAVAAAQANGAWSALDAVEDLVEPDDLRAALAAVPAALAHWTAFPPSTRRAVLEWLASAKRAETRAARVATTVAEAAEGRRANQWRQPGGARR